MEHNSLLELQTSGQMQENENENSTKDLDGIHTDNGLGTAKNEVFSGNPELLELIKSVTNRLEEVFNLVTKSEEDYDFEDFDGSEDFESKKKEEDTEELKRVLQLVLDIQSQLGSVLVEGNVEVSSLLNIASIRRALSKINSAELQDTLRFTSELIKIIVEYNKNIKTSSNRRFYIPRLPIPMSLSFLIKNKTFQYPLKSSEDVLKFVETNISEKFRTDIYHGISLFPEDYFKNVDELLKFMKICNDSHMSLDELTKIAETDSLKFASKSVLEYLVQMPRYRQMLLYLLQSAPSSFQDKYLQSKESLDYVISFLQENTPSLRSLDTSFYLLVEIMQLPFDIFLEHDNFFKLFKLLSPEKMLERYQGYTSPLASNLKVIQVTKLFPKHLIKNVEDVKKLTDFLMSGGMKDYCPSVASVLPEDFLDSVDSLPKVIHTLKMNGVSNKLLLSLGTLPEHFRDTKYKLFFFIDFLNHGFNELRKSLKLVKMPAPQRELEILKVLDNLPPQVSNMDDLFSLFEFRVNSAEYKHR